MRSLHASSQESQEQLRQLQDSLHSAKEQDTETQHQLHGKYLRVIYGQKVEKMTANIKKPTKLVTKVDFNFVHCLVEELQLRLQKEQTLSNDLRSTLEAEKSRGLEQQRQLEAELKAVSVLKAELEETRLQLQSSYKIQEELKGQIQKLRYGKLVHAPLWKLMITWVLCRKLFFFFLMFALRLKLENDEAEHQACLQAVKKEQARVQELQEDLQQQRLNSQQTIEQNHQTQEVIHIFDVLTFW